MAERTDAEQDLHDRAIEFYAERFASDDIRVQADISGYEAPRTLNGETPDVLAIGERTERAFEIETDSSDDVEQRKALEEWANEHVQRVFRWGVVTEDGTVDRWRK